MRKGRVETVDEPAREPVTISIDTLGHWPRELGSLDEKALRKVVSIADRDIARLFENLFPTSDLDKWKAVSARRLPPGNYHKVMVNGA